MTVSREIAKGPSRVSVSEGRWWRRVKERKRKRARCAGRSGLLTGSRLQYISHLAHKTDGGGEWKDVVGEDHWRAATRQAEVTFGGDDAAPPQLIEVLGAD